MLSRSSGKRSVSSDDVMRTLEPLPARTENSLANRSDFRNRIIAIKPISVMPGKSNSIESENAGNGDRGAMPAGTTTGKPTARPASTGRKNARPARKKSEAAPKKKSSKQPVLARTAGASDEEIRLRAYFISERRHRLALPGDASSDWLEAKRQLLSETGR